MNGQKALASALDAGCSGQFDDRALEMITMEMYSYLRNVLNFDVVFIGNDLVLNETDWITIDNHIDMGLKEGVGNIKLSKLLSDFVNVSKKLENIAEHSVDQDKKEIWINMHPIVVMYLYLICRKMIPNVCIFDDGEKEACMDVIADRVMSFK